MSYVSAKAIVQAKQYRVFKKSDAAAYLQSKKWCGSQLHVLGRKTRLVGDRYPVVRFQREHWENTLSEDAFEVIRGRGPGISEQLVHDDHLSSAAADMTDTHTHLCLMGPIWAKIPHFTDMKDLRATALSDMTDFDRLVKSKAYSPRKIQVLLLAGWNEEYKTFVELKNLAAFPAVRALPGGSAYK